MQPNPVLAPSLGGLLLGLASHARREKVTAALEAADMVRRMRGQAVSVHGTRAIVPA
jgi:uncharacterized protein YjeT (DUF2065 family)